MPFLGCELSLLLRTQVDDVLVCSFFHRGTASSAFASSSLDDSPRGQLVLSRIKPVLRVWLRDEVKVHMEDVLERKLSVVL